MAKDEFDFDPEQAMDQLGNVKPTSAVKMSAKLLGGPLKDAVELGADIVDTTDDGLSTKQMSLELADSLGGNVATLNRDSELARTANYYHENGDALLNAGLGAARDVGISMIPGGTAYLIAEGAWNYANAEEKPDPTGDLRVLYKFSKNKNPTPTDVMDAIKAKIHPEARVHLRDYSKDGFGADNAIDPYIGDLIGPDFIPGDGISKAEYIAEKIRIGEYEPAVIILDKPIPMRPLKRSMEEIESEQDIDQEEQEEDIVAVNHNGSLAYSNSSREPSFDNVDYDEPLATPRTPAVKRDPRFKAPDIDF